MPSKNDCIDASIYLVKLKNLTYLYYKFNQEFTFSLIILKTSLNKKVMVYEFKLIIQLQNS